MKIPYKAGQLALYGSGEEIYIATADGKNRIVVFDSRAVLTLSWDDRSNTKSMFSVSINRRGFLNIIRKGKPRNGFYDLRLAQGRDQVVVFDHAILLETSDLTTSMLGIAPFKQIDINRVNDYYCGLVTDQAQMTGSFCVDFDGLRYVMDFLHNYIAAGTFGGKNARVVNFQTVNDNFPLVCQAFVKCDDSMICDLDVAIIPFKK